MDDLPHLIVDEPKRSRKTLVAIIAMSLLVVLIPIGVFLQRERTQVKSQAATEEKVQTPQTSISLLSKSSPISDGSISVDVIIKSDLDALNLVSSKIKFDPTALKLEKIATSSAESASTNLFFVTKWLETSYDNQKGTISLVGGIPSPGVKTNLDSSLSLATLIFTPLKTGSTSLSLEDNSSIFRNSDNIDILKTKNSLELNIDALPGSGFAQLSPHPVLKSVEPKVSPSSSPKATPKTSAPPAGGPSPTPVLNTEINLLNPVGGEVFSYIKPVSIGWTSLGVDKIKAISLFLNDEYFGSIAQDIQNTNKFDWTPAQTLLIPYIGIQNTYTIEVVGVNKKGEQVKSKSDGPFGIIAKEEVSLASQSASFQDISLTLTNISQILTNFNKSSEDRRVDLNGDGMVNQIDFWLSRKILLQRGLISE